MDTKWMEIMAEKCQKIDKLEAQFNRWFRFWSVILSFYLILSGMRMLCDLLSFIYK